MKPRTAFTVSWTCAICCTAAFCGALRRGFTDTAFVEIFCPDWKGNRVLLSHMGKMNYACTDGELELVEMNFIYGAENPVVAYGRYRAGQGNLRQHFPCTRRIPPTALPCYHGSGSVR